MLVVVYLAAGAVTGVVGYLGLQLTHSLAAVAAAEVL